MKQLNLQFYPREEIAEIVNIPATKQNFKRGVETTLDKWGYKYEYSRKGVIIIEQPQTAAAQLKELLIREYNIDVQVDIEAFSCFLYLLMVYEDFQTMPWNERENELENTYGIKISERTLRSWYKKLEDNDLISKFKVDAATWCSFRLNGKTEREMVDGNPELEGIKRKYEHRRRELLEKTKSWKITITTLWEEFRCCFYTCNKLILNGIETDLLKLVEDTVNEFYPQGAK